jgi:hypothetical protein
MGITLSPIGNDHANANAHHLLAYEKVSGEVVAVLSVVETSGDDEIHQRYGLTFPAGVRIARYTQMAVLQPFRGLDLPLKLILEAHHRFVAPSRYDHTWLLFDAERAVSSNLCRWLAFKPGERVYLTEYGCSRVLQRDERTLQAHDAVLRAREFVERMSPVQCHVGLTRATSR